MLRSSRRRPAGRLRRLLVVAVAGNVVVGAGAMAVDASPASASTAGSSYSTAVYVTPGPGLNVTVTPTGLLSPLQSLTSGVVTPLVSGLTGLVSDVVATTANGLLGTLDSAISGVGVGIRTPFTDYPACGTRGWSSGNCYGPLLPNIDLSPLAEVDTGLVQGYAMSGSQGYSSRSHIAGAMISLLGLPLINLGAVDAQASCAAGGACTASHSLTSVSLLNGLIGVQLAGGGSLLQVSLNNGPFIDLSSLSAVLTPISQTVSVALYNNLLKVVVGISLSSLLDDLGLGGILSGLSGLIGLDANVALTLLIGPGDVTTANGTAQSWGLGVGLDLSGTVSVNLLGLLGATVSIDTGITSTSKGNLLDLRAGYANATAGTTPSGSWTPPGLI